MNSQESTRQGPLCDVRIIDLTSVFLGPYCTQMLGDLGATVVKIESPSGDTTRQLGPARNPKMSGTFLNVNRNKHSIVIDLKSRGAAPVIERLIEHADVLVYNLRPQSMVRLGLSYERVAAINPRLIYCGAYGYGERGPDAGKPAFDDSIQAVSGVAAYQGMLAGEPMYCATVIADKVTGMAAANAVLAALYERQVSGLGQRIDVPMFETMVGFVLAEHLFGAAFEPPLSEPIYGRAVSPHRRPYRTLDGYVAVVPYNDKQWARFFALVGRADLAADPRFANMAVRTKNIDELYSLLASEVEKRTSSEWLKILEENDIPAVPVTRPSELLTNPHLEAVGMFRADRHPSEGELRTVMPATEFSRTPSDVWRLAPRLGEHTVEILRGAGYSSQEVDALRRRSVVFAEEDLS